MNQASYPPFEQGNIGEALDGLAEDALNLLPYGVVKLSGEGRVLFYSEREGELSGFLPERALGHHWLIDVAPCMDSPMFRERIFAAAESNALDVYFSNTGDFSNAGRELRMRLVSSLVPKVCWLLVRRD